MSSSAASATPVGTTDALAPFFESYYRRCPVNATFTGVHDYDDRLPDWSLAGLDAAVAEMRAQRRALAPHLADAANRPVDVATADVALADAFLEIQTAELDGHHFQRGNPSLWIGEAIFSVIGLVIRDFAPLEQRMESAAARLAAIPSFLQQAVATVRAPVPALWAARARQECAGAIILLEGGITRWLQRAGVPEAVRRAVRQNADAARVAVAEFDAWLGALPAAPASRYAVGETMLDLLLRRGHWCTRPRSELLREARAQLDEALAALHTSAAAAAPGGWREVQERLAAQHPPADDYYAAYQRTWDACRQLSDARELVSWPEAPIRYGPIPIETRDAAPSLYYLFYRSPAPLDPVGIHDYVVTPVEPDMPADEQAHRLRANNDSVIKLNHVVHHGALGHHVQNHFARSAASRIGRVAAVDCASRIAMFGGGTMAEGWACYATDLMDEVGFLAALEQIAEQHTRARLLARAVVDLSLHAGAMTLEQCIALYEERIGMPAAAARAEAVRNSMFPGTAVMYWLGTQGIHALRAERQRAEGARFSLRAFHDHLLSLGSIPVPMAAAMMARGAAVA